MGGWSRSQTLSSCGPSRAPSPCTPPSPQAMLRPLWPMPYSIPSSFTSVVHSPAPPPEAAPPEVSPFDDLPMTDTILRSNDGVKYCVSKAALAQASPVFANMLSLPLPHDNGEGRLHMLALAEPADVLDVLLQFCIPRTPPSLDDLATAVRVLEGARAYQIAWALDSARAALMRFAADEPVRVYAIARRYGLENEAREAARSCLRVSLESIIASDAPELRHISAKAFQDLLFYRQSCASDVVCHIQSWAWVETLGRTQPEIRSVWNASHCHSSCLVTRRDNAGCEQTCKVWWDNYMKHVVETLRARTWEDSVSAQDAIEHILRGGNCDRCRDTSLKGIRQFSQAMAAEVAARIATVANVFDHSTD